MSIQGQGKISEYMKGRVFVYVPAGVHNDSAFPFKIGEKVRVRIDGERLIVEKAK